MLLFSGPSHLTDYFIFGCVVNELSIIDHSFLDNEVLKAVFCATILIGIHITGPYQQSFINMDTSHDMFFQGFPTLYQEVKHMEQ